MNKRQEALLLILLSEKERKHSVKELTEKLLCSEKTVLLKGRD